MILTLLLPYLCCDINPLSSIPLLCLHRRAGLRNYLEEKTVIIKRPDDSLP